MSLSDLTLSHEWLPGGVVVVHAAGDIDVYEASKLRDYMREHLKDQRCRHIVMEASELDYLESTGLGLMVGVLKWLRGLTDGAGVFALAGAGPHITKIFTITGLTKVFPLYATVEAAVVGIENMPRPADPIV